MEPRGFTLYLVSQVVCYLTPQPPGTTALSVATPIVLSQGQVHLSPISLDDLGGFQAIALDPRIWTHYPVALSNEQEVADFVSHSCEMCDRGIRYPLTIRVGQQIAGTTSYGSFSLRECRVEIGWTWLGCDFQGIGLNQQVKQLMLEHAFNSMNCERVEFKTDTRNVAARKSLERLGAQCEGVMRSHLWRRDGSRRDTVLYSILRSEYCRPLDRSSSGGPIKERGEAPRPDQTLYSNLY